ncbi:DNA-directed RNA polymerase, subunit M [Pyrobaculum islandicum DSM 4184]|uniref:DNA-directed RNA polymerase, subunit M n=1 Tax=Pyrobaculum islandicum (strain DSM 4184 / JCM 9189 / GEO3) TaxID=384616 RepID=A1RSM0_PYRIL|nr:DNA-directed RNA polymerase [Pyrobaculum islandicum]ABL87952.1 DNA-directed RNA polymerase, subunit M [Pyrobaculum islandicum DSM 4184]
MRFCPRDGTLMIPQKKDGITVLKCPKCGYEVKLTEKTKEAYRQRSEVSEERKRGVMVAEERKIEYDQEEVEELRRQLLENLQEAERESD